MVIVKYFRSIKIKEENGNYPKSHYPMVITSNILNILSFFSLCTTKLFKKQNEITLYAPESSKFLWI